MAYVASGEAVDVSGDVTEVKDFSNNFRIVKIADPNLGNVKLKGGLELANLAKGMKVTLHARRSWNDKYDEFDYKNAEITSTQHTTDDSIIEYLSSSAFKDIGPVAARLMVDALGLDMLERLAANPELIHTVPKLSKRKAEAFLEAWKTERANHRLMSALMACGLGGTLSNRVKEKFGSETLNVLENEPYRLIEVTGIGFKMADDIAIRRGMKPNDPERYIAALHHVLLEAAQSGDCYSMYADVAAKAKDLTDTNPSSMATGAAFKALVERGKVVTTHGGSRISLTHIANAEERVANRLRDMLETHSFSSPLVASKDAMRSILVDLGIAEESALSPEQEDAVYTALTAPICVITGGPGTGKSFCTRALCQAFDYFNVNISLCSPTGRASKRLKEATGRQASTIHRLLEWGPEGPGFGLETPLETDAVLIDESSMLDITLCAHLMDAVEDHMRLIFVGDIDQLPSVGAGAVLHDLISSGVIPVVRLNRIFRQAAGSEITTAAYQVREGVTPDLPTPKEAKGRTVMYVGSDKPLECVAFLERVVTEVLPKLGFKKDDIQVLSPLRGGDLGIESINPILQNLLNPQNSKGTIREVVVKGISPRTLRVGDRVMQTKNDYKRGEIDGKMVGIFNGDIGTISEIVNGETDVIKVNFPDLDEDVEYPRDKWDELLHSYCSTVHRAQGAEYPAVIVLCHEAHKNMLQRNLFYTALTRAKKLAFIIGQKKAVETAVGNKYMKTRLTSLAERLQGTNEFAAVQKTPKAKAWVMD